MKGHLIATERVQLRQWHQHRCDNDGYVKVTAVLMLDAGWSVAAVVETLGPDKATVYRYARAFAASGLARYLAHEQPSYWGTRLPPPTTRVAPPLGAPWARRASCSPSAAASGSI